jgi:hypothetical protein
MVEKNIHFIHKNDSDEKGAFQGIMTNQFLRQQCIRRQSLPRKHILIDDLSILLLTTELTNRT